jgi:hypothetical protein
MPFKFREAQRHHILKARYRVHNWPDDDCGLVRRGDIRVWLPEDAIGGWRAVCRTTPGGQGRFSNLAIETTLILGAALRLPLRQTEGFMRSLMEVMKLEFAVPDHTTLARRRRTVDVKDDRWPRKGPIDILIGQNRPQGLWRRRVGQAWRTQWRNAALSTCRPARRPLMPSTGQPCTKTAEQEPSISWLARGAPIPFHYSPASDVERPAIQGYRDNAEGDR